MNNNVQNFAVWDKDAVQDILGQVRVEITYKDGATLKIVALQKLLVLLSLNRILAGANW